MRNCAWIWKSRWLAKAADIAMGVNVIWITLGMAVMVGAGLIWVVHEIWRQDELAELDHRARLLAEHLAIQSAALVRRGDVAELQRRVQALATFIAGLSAVRNGPHEDEQMKQLLALATETLCEVHDLSHSLRPAELDAVGLVPALRKLSEVGSQRLELKVDFEAIGLERDARSPQAVEVALYRISQEAITNAVHHGRAKSVDILLQRKAASVLEVIDDDGRGFDTQGWQMHGARGDHLGLLGIQERTSLLGGTLQIESSPGAGTSLFVELPLGENGHG